MTRRPLTLALAGLTLALGLPTLVRVVGDHGRPLLVVADVTVPLLVVPRPFGDADGCGLWMRYSIDLLPDFTLRFQPPGAVIKLPTRPATPTVVACDFNGSAGNSKLRALLGGRFRDDAEQAG